MALIPKFSIRQLLLAMVGLAAMSAILAGALRGNTIAFGLVVGVTTLIVPAIGLTISYWVLYGAAVGLQIRSKNIEAKKKILGWFLLFAATSGWTVPMAVVGQTTIVPAGKSGYLVTIDNSYPGSATGCRPIRVSLATCPTGLVTKDIEFTVVIKANLYGAPDEILSAPLVIESGQSSSSVEIYYPSLYGNSYQGSEIFIERGVGNLKYEPTRDVFHTSIDIFSYNYSTQPGLLLVSSNFATNCGDRFECYRNQVVRLSGQSLTSIGQLPAVDTLVGHYSDPVQGSFAGGGALAAIDWSTGMHGCHPSDLPNSWIGLSTVQQILVSLTDLKSVSITDDSARDTIQRWVAAGGTLVVYDVGSDFEQSDQILPLLIGKRKVEDRGMLKQAWLEPSKKLSSVPKIISFQNEDYQMQYGQVDDQIGMDETDVTIENAWDSFEPAADLKATTDKRSPPKFIRGTHLNGQILAVAGNMQNWQPADWMELQNSIQVGSHGLAVQLGNSQGIASTTGFTVPGVGEPPVRAFQILIALFIFAAGPVMYFVLRKTAQMHLLFLLVPLLSLTVCFGLVVYAVFIDGFQSWGRSQSVTWLDQKIGSAVSHARRAYYCGVQPAPYRYSLDTLTMTPKDHSASAELIRQTSRERIFSGGCIRPRTPHQVIIARSFPCEQSLIWLPSRNGIAQDSDSANTDSMTVRNQLGATVVYAAAKIASKSGALNWVQIENLKDDGTNVAKPTDANAINEELKKLVDLHSPEYQSTYRRNSFAQRAYISVNGTNGSGEGAEHQMVDSIRQRKGCTILTEPNSYIAVLESFPVVADPNESVNYKKQLHVIIGKW